MCFYLFIYLRLLLFISFSKCVILTIDTLNIIFFFLFLFFFYEESRPLKFESTISQAPVPLSIEIRILECTLPAEEHDTYSNTSHMH
jgi:hypothetical protein